ncbi:MAG: hypothetical protein Q9182_000162 [Xanthomendoza sp. 2 TL-2023]
MGSRTNVMTTFEPERVIQPIYTGGDVALDGEGQILATCLGEEAVLTDLKTGRILARLEGDGEVLTALAITPSASHLILSSRSLSMQIYSLQPSEDGPSTLTPILLRTLKPHSTPVITIAIDRSGTLLGTGSADGVIKVWDIRGGFVTHTLRGHNGVISALHFFESTTSEPTSEMSSKQKKKRRKGTESEGDRMDGVVSGDMATARFRLASGSEDGKIRIWDLSKRKSIATLDSHVSVVRDIEFSPILNVLVSGSRDKTAILWDAQTWTTKRVIPVIEIVEAVGFIKESTLLYTGGESGRLRVWDSETGRELTEEQTAGGDGDEIIRVLQNTGSQFLLTVHADQSLLLHSTSSLSEHSTSSKVEPLPLIRRISGTHDEIIDLAYVTPDRSLLALATNSESIRLVSLATQTSGSSSVSNGDYFGADVALLQGHEEIIICLDVDSTGCWLATGAKDNTARLWKIDHAQRSYDHYATFTGHAESLGAISLAQRSSSSDSNSLAHPPSFLLTGSQDKTVKRWNIGRLPRAENFDGKSKPLSRALYTRKAHDKDINAISINHNNTLFASASQDRTVKIWSVEDGEVQGILRGHRRGVWSVMFAPKDTPAISGDSTGPASTRHGVVLTGSGDKTVKIWSLTDYSCLRTLEGHTNSVLKVLWMPLRPSEDATTTHHKRPVHIASAGGDGLVKIWDANTGEPACTLDNHTDRIWALTVDPSTNTLVSGGGDSVITFWTDTSSLTTAAAAAASTERVEQEQQLMNYVHAGRYRDAITLALALHHPARLLSLFQAVIDLNPPEPGSLSGDKAVDEVLVHLSDEQLLELLRRVRDWNTNARTAVVAQRILNVVVRSYSAERLAGLRGRGWKEVVDGLRAYTERHYKRMAELVDESYLVEFTLREMEEVGVV